MSVTARAVVGLGWTFLGFGGNLHRYRNPRDKRRASSLFSENPVLGIGRQIRETQYLRGSQYTYTPGPVLRGT